MPSSPKALPPFIVASTGAFGPAKALARKPAEQAGANAAAAVPQDIISAPADDTAKPPAPKAEPLAKNPRGPTIAPELVTRAVQSLSVINGGRAFEVRLGRILRLPGVPNLDNADMLGIREHVRRKLLQQPARPGGFEAVRALAFKVATDTRIGILTHNQPDLVPKARALLAASHQCRQSLFTQWPSLIASLENSDIDFMKDAVPPLRRNWCDQLVFQAFSQLATEAPVASTDMQTYAGLLTPQALLARATALLPSFIAALPQSQRTRARQDLLERFSDRFISRYAQGADPAIRYAGSDGLCLGLTIQWLRDGGRLQLDTPLSVGDTRAARIRNSQRAIELSKRMFDAPGFMRRKAVLRQILATHDTPAWRNIVASTQQNKNRLMQAQTESLRSGDLETPGSPKSLGARAASVGDFAMPERMVNGTAQSRVARHFDEVIMTPQMGAYESVKRLLDARVARGLEQLHQTQQATHWAFGFTFDQMAHAVGLSVQQDPTTQKARLVFFDSNSGELAFEASPGHTPGAGLDAFAEFAGWYESWMSKMWDSPCRKVALLHSLQEQDG